MISLKNIPALVIISSLAACGGGGEGGDVTVEDVYAVAAAGWVPSDTDITAAGFLNIFPEAL